jgi:hypothetical protein
MADEWVKATAGTGLQPGRQGGWQVRMMACPSARHLGQSASGRAGHTGTPGEAGVSSAARPCYIFFTTVHLEDVS